MTPMEITNFDLFVMLVTYVGSCSLMYIAGAMKGRYEHLDKKVKERKRK